MCRNIRQLHNFDPPTTDDEVREGCVDPLTLRTNWRAASRTSSSVVGGWKLWSTRMLRHMR